MVVDIVIDAVIVFYVTVVGSDVYVVVYCILSYRCFFRCVLASQ